MTPRGQYSKNIPAKAQTIVVEPKKESTLEQYIRLGVKKVTLPDGTVLEF